MVEEVRLVEEEEFLDIPQTNSDSEGITYEFLCKCITEAIARLEDSTL